MLTLVEVKGSGEVKDKKVQGRVGKENGEKCEGEREKLKKSDR